MNNKIKLSKNLKKTKTKGGIGHRTLGPAGVGSYY
jgi:hypothetical protein